MDITTDNEALCTHAGGIYAPYGVNAYCADDSFTVNEGTISGDGELVLLDNQHADISAADLGDWGTSSFDLDLSIKANSGTNIAAVGDYAVLFARSQHNDGPYIGPMAFVWNDGQVLFRLRAEESESLLLEPGTVSSWSDWVNLRFLYHAPSSYLRVSVDGVEAGHAIITMLVDPTPVVGAPLRFGGNHADPDVQNLNARIRNIVRLDFEEYCQDFIPVKPGAEPPWGLAFSMITDGCTVDITTDNAAVAASVCNEVWGTNPYAGTSTCNPASSYDCWIGGFCSQAAIDHPTWATPATGWANAYEGHTQTTDPALAAGCNSSMMGGSGEWANGAVFHETLNAYFPDQPSITIQYKHDQVLLLCKDDFFFNP